MKLTTLCAALVIAASVNVASAGLFRHHRGNDCCAPEATCCAPAATCAAPCGPTCGAPACAPACAAPACAAPACAPACAAPACAPACAAPACAAPACCAPAPNDCCAPVSHCGRKHKLAGWFKGLKKHGCHKCDDVCDAGPACAPNCGAPVGPNCGAPCGACN